MEKEEKKRKNEREKNVSTIFAELCFDVTIRYYAVFPH